MSPRLHICSVFITFNRHNYPPLPKLHSNSFVIFHSLWSIHKLSSSDLIYFNPSNAVPSLINRKKKREEWQREQTKPVSVTKIPTVEEKWNPCGLCSPSNSSIIMHQHIFWESQLPLVGLLQSKFCRHPTAFHPSDSPSSSTEGPLTSKVNASRNSKEQSARFLLVVHLGNDGKSKLVIAASLSQFQSNQHKWHHFLQLGFRATVDSVKAFITILVKHIYASANHTS